MAKRTSNNSASIDSNSAVQPKEIEMTNMNNTPAEEGLFVNDPIGRDALYRFAQTERVPSGYIAKHPVLPEDRHEQNFEFSGRSASFKYNNGAFFSAHLLSDDVSRMIKVTDPRECSRIFNAYERAFIFTEKPEYQTMEVGFISRLSDMQMLTVNLNMPNIGWMTGLYQGNNVTVEGGALKPNEVARVSLKRDAGLVAVRVQRNIFDKDHPELWTDEMTHVNNGINLVRNITSLLCGVGYMLQPIFKNAHDESEAVTKYGGESVNDFLWFRIGVWKMAADKNFAGAKDVITAHVEGKTVYSIGVKIGHELKNLEAQGKEIVLPAQIKSVDTSTGEIVMADSKSLLGKTVDCFRGNIPVPGMIGITFKDRDLLVAKARGLRVVAR